MVYKCEAIIEKVKVKVGAVNLESQRTILSIFEFSVTVDGAEVKKYTIDLKTLKVYEGPSNDGVDVSVVIDDDALEMMLKKEITLEDAAKEGKLKVTGDNDAIAKMKALTKKLIEDA